SNSFTQNQRIQILYTSDTNLAELVRLKTLAKDSFEVKKIAQTLLSELRAESFLSASIDSIKFGNNNEVEVFVTSGSRYEWGTLKQGNITDAALNQVNFREKIYFNRPFNKKEIIILLENLLQFYENNGYPFARIALKDVEIVHTNSIEANLYVNTGPLYKVDSVIIHGNSNIGEKYLYNYIGIKPGDIYSDKIVNNVGERIN